MSSTYKLVSLSPQEVFELLKGNNAVLVDVRPEYETNYRVFEVPEILCLPYDSYCENYQIISKDIYLIVADSVGIRSAEVALYLIEKGYTQVACLAGGIIAWERA